MGNPIYLSFNIKNSKLFVSILKNETLPSWNMRYEAGSKWPSPAAARATGGAAAASSGRTSRRRRRSIRARALLLFRVLKKVQIIFEREIHIYFKIQYYKNSKLFVSTLKKETLPSWNMRYEAGSN